MRKGLFFFLFLISALILAKGVSGLLNPSELPRPEGFQEGPLGSVYDVENRLLAESVKTRGLVLLPQAFEVEPQNLSLLARATGRSVASLTLLLSETEEPLFIRSVSSQELGALEALRGVYVRSYYVRRYPFESLTCLLAPSDGSWQGLETYYQKLLSQPDTDLRLSIKIEWQKALERDLRWTLKKLRAQAGGAVILDLKTGRVKAMVTSGSPALLLERELPLSVIGVPFEEAFYESMYERQEDFLRDLGFGEPTGIDLPRETVGVLPLEIESLSEVSASPLQIVRALAILATGRYFSPKIALEVRSGKERYFIPVPHRELEDLVPRFRGGHWWWGGSRKAGSFLLAGLWPRRAPRLAYLVYAEGVKVWGLPLYYTRFIPKTLKLSSPRSFLAQKRSSPPERPHLMPDVRGLTLKAALEHLSPLGLKVNFSGFGVTVKQWPAPGTSLRKVKECYLVLR